MMLPWQISACKRVETLSFVYISGGVSSLSPGSLSGEQDEECQRAYAP